MAQVNSVVAVLIWLMIDPMMLKVEPGCLSDVGPRPKRLALTLTINWLVASRPDVGAGLLLPTRVRRLGASRRSRGVHRRNDPVGRGTVHRIDFC